MPFSAINTYEQELKQRNERHTLELQLEQAMQVYQSALEAQRVNEIQDAYDHYTRLFAFDVLKPVKPSEKPELDPVVGDSSGDTGKNGSTGQAVTSGISARSLQLGPAIRLRAMALKNFALLLLAGDDVDSEKVNQAFEHFSEALDLVGTDDKEKLILPSLVSIAWSIGFTRLARLGLEVLVQNSEGSAIVPLEEWIKSKHSAEMLFGPRTLENLRALEYINSLLSNRTTAHEKPPKCLQIYEKLARIREEQPSLQEVLQEESHVEVSLPAKSWEALITSLNDTLSSASRRNKRKNIKDSYAWSQRDLYCIEFVGTPFQETNAVSDSEPLTAITREITADMSADSIQSERAQDISNPEIVVETTADMNVDENSKVPQTPPNQEPYEYASVSQSPSQGTGGEVGSATASPSENPPHAQPQTNTTDSGHELHLGDHGARSDTPVLVASPIKRRRVDRVKRSASLALPADFGVVDANFASQFNAYLALIDQKYGLPRFFSPANLFLDSSQETIPAELVGAAKLKEMLSNWDSKESLQLLMEAASAKPQKGGIMFTLRKGSVNDFTLTDSEDEDEDIMQDEDIHAESVAVQKFVASHNKLHIQQIRWDLARVLLDKLALGNQTKAFGRVVFNFIDEFESSLWERRQFLTGDQCWGVFALYADRWLRSKDKDVQLKLVRWQNITSSLYPSLPQAWICAFVNQESELASPESSVMTFEEILEIMNTKSYSEELASLGSLLSYLERIPQLTIANLQIQVSKFKAAAAFERVLTPPDSKTEAPTNEGNSGTGVKYDETEDIKLLEAMLMPEKHAKPDSTSDSEFEAIQNFLGYAQPQFKMGLWYILLEKYEAAGSAADSLVGLTQIFSEAVRSLDKGEPLLQVLSVTHDVGKRLVPLLERNPDLLVKHITINESVGFLGQVIKLLQTLHLFLLYDDAVNSNLLQKPIIPSWPKALTKLREIVVMWWCVFYRFWLRCLPDKIAQNQETINDILSIIHERLGNLGYCGVAQACLLNLHFSEIARMNWDGSALDMSQCLKCKFGLQLTLYGDVANHHTMPLKLEEKDATLLLPFIMRMILRHRSFQQAVMRMETRAVIDELTSAYRSKDETKHRKSIENVEAYLSRDFGPELLRRAWHGHDNSRLSYVEGDDANGAWLLQAGILMNQYKMRRRQAYAASSIKTESLFQATELFIDDIAAKPTRLESWSGLAQAYLFICEDCLIFGDELNLDNEPEVFCKKALLAAAHAISLVISDLQPNRQKEISVAHKETCELFRQSIWSLFGYAMLLAVMPPITKQPFTTMQRPLQPLLVELPSNKTTRLGIKRPDEISDRLALKIAFKCLSKHQDPQQQWVSYIHQAMIAHKLDLGPAKVLHFAEKAQELSPRGLYDAETEIIYYCWQYYREKKMGEDELRSNLSKLQIGTSTTTDEEAGESSDPLQLIESKLRWLVNKIKWLHRPRFILAKIAELDYSDTAKAQQELMHVFSLKSPSKPLVIWKTDSDLPGQHGVYMTEYIKFMSDLMYSNGDSSGLMLMLRRFRRTGGEMWNHAGTYEYVFAHLCEYIHKQIPVDSTVNSKYSDVLMSEIGDNSEKFDKTVKQMTAHLDSTYDESDKWTLALYFVVEVRKLHSGPSTIAMADELVIIIFLLILKKYRDTHPHADEEPVPTKAPSPQQAQSQSASMTTNGNGTPKNGTNGSADSNGASKNNTTAPVPGAENERSNGPVTKVSSRRADKPTPRRKLIRKDVIFAAQAYLRPVQAALSKADDLRIPTDLKI